MNATETTRVEIDDRIREQPDMFRAVTEATTYLLQQAVEVPPPGMIRWRYADTDGMVVEITLADINDSPSLSVSRDYWTRWILDPVNQKLCVLRTWGALLDRRLDRHAVRVNDLLIELEREENDGNQVAQRVDSGVAT